MALKMNTGSAGVPQAQIVKVLKEIIELGFVSIINGMVSSSIPPVNNIYMSQWDRWSTTLNYLNQYASQHKSFEGDFFICLYDGWREYSYFVPPLNRTYVDWTTLSSQERLKFTGIGSLGEARFTHDSSRPYIYPVLPAPVLAYNRHLGDNSTLLIPDYEFLASAGFSNLSAKVDAADTLWPWELKSSRPVIWRGSRHVNTYSHSFEAVAANCLNDVVTVSDCMVRLHPRDEAVAISSVSSLLLDASYARTTIMKQLQYRMQLDMDGMVNAWSGLFWKLRSASLVVKLLSGWEQWYYDLLEAGVHCVFINRLNELEWWVRYCEANNDHCRETALQGQLLAKTLTIDYALSDYVIH